DMCHRRQYPFGHIRCRIKATPAGGPRPPTGAAMMSGRTTRPRGRFSLPRPPGRGKEVSGRPGSVADRGDLAAATVERVLRQVAEVAVLVEQVEVAEGRVVAGVQGVLAEVRVRLGRV